MQGRLTSLLARRVRHADVDFNTRGFPACAKDTREHLEARAHAFVTGAQTFAANPEVPHAALEDSLELELRGFGYEGAGMVAALADLAALGRGWHLHRLLAGEGVRYRHLAHVGAGWGLSVARVGGPRALRRLDPLLRWLTLDGRGFHHEYFAPERTLANLRARGDDDAAQLHSSGVGRALWFTRGADLPRIAVDIAVSPPYLQSSMWSGVGLAACYAGRPDGVDVEELRTLAGRSAAHVGQGVVFALAARHAHGLPVDPDRQRLAANLGVRPFEAAALADRTCDDLACPGAGAASMNTWRARIVSTCPQAELEGGPKVAHNA